MLTDERTFQQSLLSEYGDCIAAYRGKGVLSLVDGKKLDCQFDAGQLTNGKILLLCDFLRPFPTCLIISAANFEGTTSDGFRICANKAFTEVYYLPDMTAERSEGVWAAFCLHELSVEIAEDKNTDRLHFGITNFEFIGTKPTPRSDNSLILTLPLDLQNNSRLTKLLIRPLDLYEKLMKRVQTLKSIGVSSEVIAEIPRDGSIAMATEVVDDLCYILSVARGTKIQWLYCDHYDKTGKLILRKHCSRIAKAYCPLKIVHPVAAAGKETKSFIEQAYNIYVEKRESFRLHKGTIDAYLDAKGEADYLEMRGVKFAVAMEILKTVFRKAVGIKSGSFKSVIEDLCDYIKFSASKQEIDLFVACRNSLIHEGKFYCETATPKQRNDCTPLNTQTEEYMFLVNFLDRVFLKLLGYSGPYIDWRVPGSPTRREQV